MPRRNAKTKRPSNPSRGDNVVVFLGLGRDMLEWVKKDLGRDPSQRSMRLVGAPSSLNDWGYLYHNETLAEAVHLIRREIQSGWPQRIFVLYVPSRNDSSLVSTLGVVCCLVPLQPDSEEITHHSNPVAWRHDKAVVQKTVQMALHQAWRVTNRLKAEITDKRICALSLPARNFYYPDRHSTIGDVYEAIAHHVSDPFSLGNTLLPSRFNRDQLPNKAFKNQQHTDKFFQDCRGRVFPPDLYHAQNRNGHSELVGNGLPLSVRQRYRFGVTVRDGNLHYDVQFEMPRGLQREPMYCAVEGDVWVTGSHANVGVNDFLWAPDGRKESRPQEQK